MTWTIDAALALVMVAYVIAGIRRGFTRGLGTILGTLLGGIAAFLLVPFVSSFVADSLWRVVASVALVLVLLAVGSALGSMVGNTLARHYSATPLRAIDRILGGVAGLVVTALVISLLASSVTPLGIPVVSQAVGDSVVIRTIERLTPSPVQSFLARIRSVAVRDTIPNIVGALGGVTTTPEVPDVSTGTAPLRAAAASVVRVSGNAYACGQSQSGTGFVIAKDRVITNAHVVAGVSEPVIDTPGGSVLAGRIIYFDPTDDLAVIEASGLDLPVLALTAPLAKGADAVYDGYPFGGPFTTGPARVLSVGGERVKDIYGTSTAVRQVYALAADIEQGDSGGPLLTPKGSVAGVVFAKSADTPNVGYAMTVDELTPVVAKAGGLSARVASGHCTRG